MGIEETIIKRWRPFHAAAVITLQTVKAGRAVLGYVAINSGVTDATVTVKDGDNTIAIIDASNLTELAYNCDIVTALTIQLSDASVDVTVGYR